MGFQLETFPHTLSCCGRYFHEISTLEELDLRFSLCTKKEIAGLKTFGDMIVQNW